MWFRTAVDPVCTMAVDNEAAGFTSGYKGKKDCLPPAAGRSLIPARRNAPDQTGRFFPRDLFYFHRI
jgi:hypothetical protein